MQVTYEHLTKEQFPLIFRCFVEAFADYHLDLSYMNEESMYNRAVKNGVDFQSSVGAFVDGKMVGITLIGIDTWENQKSAFDAATGIIKEYRGQGIAREMFEYAIPRLKQQGVKQFLLEVLQVNEAGIKAYKKSGFEVTRELDCFKMDLKDFKRPAHIDDTVSIRSVDKSMLPRFAPHLDWMPSWENSLATVARIPDKVFIYGAFVDDNCVGIAAYYPGLKWVTTLIVDKAFRRRGIGAQLMARIIDELPPDTDTIKLVNVLHTDRGMIKFVEDLGFKEYVTQLEMAWKMKP
jgi:ribosomal protein S18 acetylase RimI-like enzyme